jgi:membrane protease YdiL (CAAX protease family)
MIAWTVGVQLVVGRGKTFSHTEWRPARRQVGVALYLISSAAIAEEAIFRGIVLPATAYYTGTLWGLAISSLLFGLVHFEKGRWGQFVAAGYGAILGGGLLVGSSLLACVLAHAAANALAFFLPGKLVGVEDSVDGS